jgi:hypothetical protein
LRRHTHVDVVGEVPAGVERHDQKRAATLADVVIISSDPDIVRRFQR